MEDWLDWMKVDGKMLWMVAANAKGSEAYTAWWVICQAHHYHHVLLGSRVYINIVSPLCLHVRAGAGVYLQDTQRIQRMGWGRGM
jgi:hypothetical protein